MGVKKHTPWFIEIREESYKNSPPVGIFKKAESLAIHDMYKLRLLCREYDISYRTQCINITKTDKPSIFRLYFKTEEEMNAIKIMR